MAASSGEGDWRSRSFVREWARWLTMQVRLRHYNAEVNRRPHRSLVVLSWVGAAVLVGTAAQTLHAGPSNGDLEAELATASGKQRLVLLGQLVDALSDVDPKKKRAYAEEGLALAERLGSAEAQASFHYHIGAARTTLGEPEAALASLERALALRRQLRDRRGEAEALNGLGIALFRLGHFADARARFEQVLPIWRELENKKALGKVHGNLGATVGMLGERRLAREHFEKALEIQRSLADSNGLAVALNNLAIDLQYSGDFAGAAALYLEGLAIQEREGNRPALALVCGNLGALYRKLKQYEKAQEYLERSLAINRELGDRYMMAGDLSNLGEVYAAKGDAAKAVSLYEEAVRLAEAVGGLDELVAPLADLGRVRQGQGRLAEARDYYQRAIDAAERAGVNGHVAESLCGLASVQRKLGDIKGALLSLQRALKFAKQPELLRDVHQQLAETYAQRREFAAAYRHRVQSAEAQDQVLNEQATSRIAEMQTKYESEKKQREIAILRRDNEIQRLRLRSERMRTYALIAGVLALVALLLLLFRRYLHLLAFWRSKSYVGHYRLLAQVGSGGMGIVYRATHVRDRTRPVAVKVLREEYAHDPVLQQRLKNEAALIDQLNHPHIVKVHERGEYDQRLFIAMEWLDGRTLARLIRESERLVLQDCVAILRQLADALAKIHSRGIVHRDVKPENIMLIEHDGDPHFVKLLDFDVAKGAAFTRLTQTGVALGTLAYMAPEQITAQEASPASDLYALGVVAYETLTREQPFFGAAPIDVVRQILDRDPIPPARLRPDIPAELDALVLELLSKRPNQRPSDDALGERLATIEAAVTCQD